jgi:hypothetical protein
MRIPFRKKGAAERPQQWDEHARQGPLGRGSLKWPGVERRPWGEYEALRRRQIDTVRRGGFRRSADAAERRLDRQRAREQARQQRRSQRGRGSR